MFLLFRVNEWRDVYDVQHREVELSPLGRAVLYFLLGALIVAAS